MAQTAAIHVSCNLIKFRLYNKYCELIIPEKLKLINDFKTLRDEVGGIFKERFNLIVPPLFLNSMAAIILKPRDSSKKTNKQKFVDDDLISDLDDESFPGFSFSVVQESIYPDEKHHAAPPKWNNESTKHKLLPAESSSSALGKRAAPCDEFHSIKFKVDGNATGEVKYKKYAIVSEENNKITIEADGKTYCFQ